MKPDPTMLYEVCPQCNGVSNVMICKLCHGAKFVSTSVKKGMIGQLNSAYKEMQIVIAAIIKSHGGVVEIEDATMKLLDLNASIRSEYHGGVTTLRIEDDPGSTHADTVHKEQDES